MYVYWRLNEHNNKLFFIMNMSCIIMYIHVITIFGINTITVMLTTLTDIICYVPNLLLPSFKDMCVQIKHLYMFCTDA